MMQWKGPCWCKGVLGSICMRSMPWFLAYSMRDFWRKLSTFLGSRAKPTRYLGAANSDMSLCVCVCVFLAGSFGLCLWKMVRFRQEE